VEDNAGKVLPIRQEYFDPKTNMSGLRGRLDVDAITVKGNRRESAPTYVLSGKNIGKKNETNVFCQALRDALSKYNSQKKSAGQVEIAGKPRYYPMLAKVYSEFMPGWLSPKLDGLRAVLTWDEKCIIYSRTLADYPPITEICEEVSAMLQANPRLYLDGELYCHGVPLQKIASAVKRQKSAPIELAKRISYNVYDCFLAGSAMEPMKFSDRLALLNRLFKEYGIGMGRVHLLPHVFVASQAEIDREYQKYLDGGYEGAMLRLDVPYDSQANNYHSSHLLKIKPRFDAEFEVVDWTVSDIGKSTGALMVKFKTDAGIEFWATPALPIEERIELGKKMPTEFEKKWKGKMITVYYAGLSVDGVPQQPTTKLVGRFD
jgi:ATP-dependent DNA ligase